MRLISGTVIITMVNRLHYLKKSRPDSRLDCFAWCRYGILPVLLLSLLACSATPPKSNEAHADKPPVELTPEARADFLSAMQAVKSAEYDRAIELFNKVNSHAHNSPVPYINLAIVYKLTGNLSKAEASLSKALKIEPENPVANNEQALLYRKMGKFAEARKVYEWILERYPSYKIAHKNLGILCDIYMKDYKCALEHYEIYSSFVPDDQNVKIWIADIQGR